MAILQDNAGKSAFHLFDLGPSNLPPKGTYAATIIDIVDKFGVERRKFEKPDEMEKVDLTAFLFGFRDRAGNAHKIDSKPMRISGNEKSALFAFLTSILGETPKMGWDYCSLKGRKVLITVAHSEGKSGQTYASIATVSPLPEGFDAAPAPAAPAPAPKKAAKPAPPPAASVTLADGDQTDEEIPF